MSGLYVFKAQVGMFDPVALQDEYVVIHYMSQRLYRQVDFFESIPPFQAIDLGALAAQTVSARTNLANLEAGENEFALFRWFPLDNVQVRLFLPTGVAKFELRNTQSVVDMAIGQRDPNLVSTEFCVWENNRPAIEAINHTDYAHVAVRIVAMGYRFHAIEIDKALADAIKARKQPATHVWCSGLPVNR